MSIIIDSITCPQCGELAMNNQRKLFFLLLPNCRSCGVKLSSRHRQTMGLLYFLILSLVFYACHLLAIGTLPGIVFAVLIIGPLFSLVPLEVNS
jgi:uncharacterized protein (DUF983 family)